MPLIAERDRSSVEDGMVVSLKGAIGVIPAR